MAYQNRISITIEAKDTASPVLAAAAAKAEEQQTAVAAAAKESADSQVQSADKAAAATTASMDEASASVKEYGAVVEETAAKTDAAMNSMGGSADKAAAGSAAAGMSNKLGLFAAATAAGVAIATGLMVKSAADFQASMTRLVTSAGESSSNLQLVSNGVLQVARDTGTGTKALAQAMYTVESGGQHGAAGLAVLKAAAQGAKTENADLVTVADAVTSAMTDYGYKADQAATVTSKLVAATGQGKTTFQDLAGAMPAILPVASAAHISLNEILGDLASMTLHGISAEQSSQNLADAIRHLQSPTQAMSKELAALGINSTELSQNLGNKGLSGTIQVISQAIQDRMGKGTTSVILNMEDALKGLPASVQAVSQEVINGTATWADWNKATKDLTVTQKSQAQAFATLYNGMHTIGTEQMTGAQVMQTYAGAMNKAMGDSAGLNVALMLTGQNTDNTTKSIQAVTNATAEAGNNVKGWGEIQKNFNQQISVLKEDVLTTGIAIGTSLLPPLTAMARGIGDVIDPIAKFISNNKDLSAGILLTVGGLSAFVALSWAVQKSAGATSDALKPLINGVKTLAKDLFDLNAGEDAQGLNKMATAFNGVSKGASSAASGVGALSKTAVPEIEAVTGAVGAEGSSVGLIGALGAIGPAGILAGVALAGVTALTVSHWSDIKNVVDGLGKSIGNVLGTNTSNSPILNPKQSQAAAAPLAKTDTSQRESQSNLMVTLTEQTYDLSKAKDDLANKTDAYNKAVDKEFQDYQKYGPNNAKVAADQATIAKLSGQMADAQSKVNDIQSKVADTTAKLDSNTIALSKTEVGLKANIDQLPAAHQKVQAAQDNVAASSVNVYNKHKDYTTALTLFGPLASKNKGDLALVQGAQHDLTGAIGDSVNKQHDLDTANNNSKTAYQTAIYWTQNHDTAIKALGLDAGTTKGMIDNLNSSLAKGGGSGASFSSRASSDAKQWLKDIGFASGTNYAPGGLALVGEQGPELVNLPQGSQVYTADKTRSMLGANGKGLIIQQLNINNNVDAGMVIRQLGWQIANA